MRKLLFLPIFILSIVACKKDVTEKGQLENGTYKGTFERINGAQGELSSAVKITINGSKYSGQSERPGYPAICNGNYAVGNGKINFSSDCVWTADFDWTLILNDKYDYTIKGDSLIISRTYAAGVKDLYKLKK